jgi:hypothetical protein
LLPVGAATVPATEADWKQHWLADDWARVVVPEHTMHSGRNPTEACTKPPRVCVSESVDRQPEEAHAVRASRKKARARGVQSSPVQSSERRMRSRSEHTTAAKVRNAVGKRKARKEKLTEG